MAFWNKLEKPGASPPALPAERAPNAPPPRAARDQHEHEERIPMAMMKREEVPASAGGTSDMLLGPGTEFDGRLTFSGTVRDHSADHAAVHLLEYEAYEEHVVPALATVAARLRAQYPDLGRIVLWHRVGALSVTDTAVVVAVAAPHRGHAFDAARTAIDAVKAEAPIWKREHHEHGADWVQCHHVDATEPSRVTA